MMLERKFTSWIPLVKADESHDDWIVSGPVADVDTPDYDGETLVKAGVMRGLDLHTKMGAHVDYEHQYPKTLDPKWLIGKSVEVTEVNGKPWMSIRLHKSGPGADLARKIWDSVKAGIRMGLSVWGSGVKDPNDAKRIIDTKIQYVTISPTPKGFGQTLQVGTPAGLYAIAKAITCDETVAGLADEWTEIESAFEKALTTGGDVVVPGDTGGAALRTQNLKGDLETETFEPPKPKSRKRKRRNALAKALASHGVRNPSAVADCVLKTIRS